MGVAGVQVYGMNTMLGRVEGDVKHTAEALGSGLSHLGDGVAHSIADLFSGPNGMHIPGMGPGGFTDTALGRLSGNIMTMLVVVVVGYGTYEVYRYSRS